MNVCAHYNLAINQIFHYILGIEGPYAFSRYFPMM